MRNICTGQLHGQHDALLYTTARSPGARTQVPNRSAMPRVACAAWAMLTRYFCGWHNIGPAIRHTSTLRNSDDRVPPCPSKVAEQCSRNGLRAKKKCNTSKHLARSLETHRAALAAQYRNPSAISVHQNTRAFKVQRCCTPQEPVARRSHRSASLRAAAAGWSTRTRWSHRAPCSCRRSAPEDR